MQTELLLLLSILIGNHKFFFEWSFQIYFSELKTMVVIILLPKDNTHG